MKRVLLIALVAALAMPYAAFAQAKPDFAGTWTLDAAKSDPPPARGGGGAGGGGGRGGGRAGGGGGGRGGGGPITITQTATEITIGNQTYKLDGTETEVQMGRGGAAKAKASWEGDKLVITTNIDAGGQAITQKAVRSLSADGKEMTVETETPAGTRKQVYTKS
jgi:opacity protein-like surface antigen